MNAHLKDLFDGLGKTWSRLTRKTAIPRRNRRTNPLAFSGVAAEIEHLEQRSLLSAAAVLDHVIAVPTIEVEKSSTSTAATSGASGYTPSQLQTAYGFNKVSLTSGANGAGQTIAIVDAYNDPTIQNDLQAFDSAFRLANPPSLKVVSQTGSTTNLPPTDPTKNKQDDWEVEESLDVEWAHALAPGANIVLVEANSASFSDLLTAVQTAAKMPGVSVVSMSWSGSEFSGESAYDSYFTTPAGHQGVTFVAATGDSGAPSGYPAYSPDVLAVGGTTLNLSSSGNYLSETGWSGSGGGISRYEAQPSYQTGIVTQTTTKRANPDVSFDADPNTGVPVYDSFSNGTSSPWAQIGGTSLSAPAWGAVIAIVDQGRAQNGMGSLDGASQTLPMLYKLDQTNPSVFHDIASGNNGYAAGTGYDLVTGLGSPVVNNLVSGMDGITTSSTSKLVFQTTPSTGTAGHALDTFSVAIENQSGQVLTNNNSTVTLSISNGPGGFASSSIISVNAVNGVAQFSNLVLDVSGNYQLTANDSGVTGSTSSVINVSAAQASKVVFVQSPTAGLVGSTLSSVTVAVEDPFGNVVTNNNSTVTISVASGPGTFSSGSITSAAAVNGIATFNNLVLVTAGTYTLNAADNGMSGATSGGFTVVSNSTTTSGFTVTATVLSSSTVELNWNTVSGAAGYRVYYSIGTNKYLLGTVSARSNSVEIVGLMPGTTYQFQIEAYHGTSVLDSNWVSVNSAAVRAKATTYFQSAPANDRSNSNW